jgi:hypothetical protein
MQMANKWENMILKKVFGKVLISVGSRNKNSGLFIFYSKDLFTYKLIKQVAGENFTDLDLLTKLLTRPPCKPSNPVLIEELPDGMSRTVSPRTFLEPRSFTLKEMIARKTVKTRTKIQTMDGSFIKKSMMKTSKSVSVQ